ncbi:hypothetical protein K0B96_08650 [Horticoccus luteus]|uniref:Uncharacterized protein n=1 Tax=Horticoccus luteus TaxID=2862869 RepID=A0A8F9TZ93_9BACT|nr:hypothetical protein [Horticoccus luteus]QYM80870.1 hypothetical protein K0B96_08650 [Horticoccus luteus]
MNRTTPAVIWWTLWSGILLGLVAIYTGLRPTIPASAAAGIRYLPLAPLLVAVLIRWVALPRVTQIRAAFPLFIVGLAFAEACGLMGLFLVPDLAAAYFILALLGLAQLAPVFAGRFEA